jgi:DNA-binding NarL/FixJ family response regulator
LTDEDGKKMALTSGAHVEATTIATTTPRSKHMANPGIEATAPLRVLIADDYPAILRMVREIIEGQSHLVVVGEAFDGAQALELAESLRPDVIILNVVMPKMSGFEVARRIHAFLPTAAIIILSTHKDAQFIERARQVGASGYVHKPDAGTELVNAINTTSQGGEFFLE